MFICNIYRSRTKIFVSGYVQPFVYNLLRAMIEHGHIYLSAFGYPKWSAGRVICKTSFRL